MLALCLLEFLLFSIAISEWKIPKFNHERADEFQKMYQYQHSNMHELNPLTSQKMGDRMEHHLSEDLRNAEFDRSMRESRVNPTVPPHVIRVLKKWLYTISQQTNVKPITHPNKKGSKFTNIHKWKIPSDEVTKKPHSNKIYEMKPHSTTLSPQKQLEKKMNQSRDFIITEKQSRNVLGEESDSYIPYRLTKRSAKHLDADELYKAIRGLTKEDLKLALSRVQEYQRKQHHMKCCFNGGTCYRKNGESWCICPPQFTGRICFEDINECAKNASMCPPHSTCRNDYGSYNCVCNPRFVKEGKDCIPQTTCKENPCTNGALCVDNSDDGTFKCICELGFSGERCEQVLRECDDSPCAKNEICISTSEGFECRSTL